jgi:predicted outer membrane repeat protein
MKKPAAALVTLFAALAATFALAASAFAAAPVVSHAIPDTTVAEDSPAVIGYRDLNRVFFDAEDLDSLAFLIVENTNPALVFASINADSALDLSFAPNASGAATIVIRATDSEALFVEDTLTVVVTPVNDAPAVVSAIPDTVVIVDDPPIANYRDLNHVFADIEDGRMLSFAIQSNSDPGAVSVTIDADSALDIGFFPDTHGQATIMVRATDSGGLSVTETFVVTVHRTLWLVEADGSGHEPTIQAAINVSLDGDTILLGDGVYTGGGNRGIGLGGREILITSRNGAASTIIDLQGADRGIILDNVGAGGTLSNITIRNGSQNQGACIKMSAASPTISGMVLQNNAAGSSGGAIYCDTGSIPTITGCVIIGNSAQDGGGIYSNAASPTIENCTFVENIATSGGAGIHLRNSNGAVVKNTIIAFSTQGPGMACTLGSTPTVSCTDIFGNAGGDALCGTDGGGNFFADPLFCGVPGSGDVSIGGHSPCNPARNPCAVLVGALPVACDLGADLTDTPNTLYPDVAFPGESAFTVHIGLDNSSDIGVMLGTASSVTFSDSVHSYISTLANPTYIPGNAKNFTVTFAAANVPADIQAPASYDLELNLAGVDDSSETYTASIRTTGRNSILVDTPKIIVSSLPLSVETVIPGSRGVPLLALSFKNGYADERGLDTLVVTNFTFGPGTAFDLDAEAGVLRLFDDVDADGGISAPDTLVASSSFAAGEAILAVDGAWSVAGLATRNLIVAADIDSMLARDSDAIDAAVVSPAHVVFQNDTKTNDDFSPLYPLNSFGRAVVNGMALHQIGFAASAADTLLGGAKGVPVLTVVVPRNGYEGDTFTALSVNNYAADFSTDDIDALVLYRDDGDGLFDTVADTRLGALVFSGDRYQISGLTEVLAPASRFFVAADVGERATNGHHFAPGIPLEGIQVASANDGPVDAAATAKSYEFENPEVVEIANLAFAPDAAAAGAENVRLLFFSIRNKTRTPVTFESLTVANATAGAGSQGDFDNTFSRVRVYKDHGNGVIDGGDTILSGDFVFSAGSFTAGGLGVGIGADETARFLIAADIDSFCAADGDTLRVRLNGSGDVGILESYPVTGVFPAVTPGDVIVDGMRAHQIELFPSADSLVVASGAHLLLLDVGIPANGYAADKLQTLVVRNEGTATTEHFERITLFADGGNEMYDDGLGDDTRLGDLVENPADPGRSFLIAGLDLPLDPPCGSYTRLFVSADVAQEYSVAGTIRFSIPVMGLRVVSGNDGPVDSPVVEPSIMLIPKPDRLTVFPYPVGDNLVSPGTSENLNAGAGFYNGYNTPLTLTGIKFYQVGTASSAEIDSVFLHADTNADGLFNPAVDRRLAALAADGVAFAFQGFAIDLEPRKISYLFLTYDMPLAVTDAATVDMTMFGPADIAVEPVGSLVEGDFPVNSPGSDVIDGMIAAQIGTGYVPPFNASPNNADIPALTLTIPPNGLWADNLQFISVENEGTAIGGRDIANVRVWREAGGDPARFDPGVEDPIDYLDWTGSRWTNSSPLGVPIPLTGLRVHITFTVAVFPVDGVTMRARLPIGGIQVASANDGPLDAAVRSPNQQTISTDPLIATLLTDRLSYSEGQTIALSLAARNEGPDTFYGVHPSLVAVTGVGTAVLSAAPSPASADMAPGSATTFVWSYTAESAGDISFCARAYSGDSLVVSEKTCTEAALIENRASGVSAALANLAPASANRGQDGVKFFRLDAAYSSSDPLGAAVELAEIRFGVKNSSGTPIAPNSVLSRIVITNPNGPDHAFSVSDSTNPVLRLVLPQAVPIRPGGGLALTATGDISDTALFTSFSFEVADLADIRIVDANDGTPAAKTTSSTFPWTTTPLAVNAPAETLLVDSPSGADVTANVGQENLRLFTLDCSNPGDPASARVIINDLRLGCFDLAGAPLPPESVLRRLGIKDGATALYDADVVAQPSGTLTVTLATPLVLSPGTARSIDVYVDLKSVPGADGFYLALENPRSVIARDINTAEFVLVSAANPASRDFPFSSDRVSLQSAASGIVAAFSDRLPAMLLPSAHGAPVMDVIVGHDSPDEASSVRVDSLALEFSFADGTPAFPGDYFGPIVVVYKGGTVASVRSPGSSSPLVEIRLSDPVIVAPASPETLSIYIDTKPLLPPAVVKISLDRQGLVVRDVNDGQRIFGIVGSFPFIAGPVSLQIPSDLAGALVVSRVPPNLAGTETNLPAFDLVLENGRSAGHTAVELRSVRVAIEGEKGSLIDPTGVASGARLVTPDSTVIDGAIGPSGIDYSLPDGLFTLASGSRDTLSFFFDIDTDLEDKGVRFVIEDSSSMLVLDVVAGTPVPVGTIGGAGYPLTTAWTHILGRGAETAYTNYPNPFAAGREQTSITYFLDSRSRVTLKLYTLWGAPVATLVDNKTQDAGLHQEVRWDGRNGDGDVVANGVYYLVLEVREDGGDTVTMKRKVGVVR